MAVHIHEGNVWEAIRDATADEPKAAWLFGSQDKQLSVDQFVLRDSRTYRTQEAHDQLQKACRALADETLAYRSFGVNLAASIMAREQNSWKRTPASLIDDIQKACVEHGHGGLWNSMECDTRDIVSIDIKTCYPASFQGLGEAKPYFEIFGHPSHRMTRVRINGRSPRISVPVLP